ncbi:MAG: GNAT family N-acetyltransferase [Flavobacteriales bacterium]|jgi:RimJ/RimL family protein N-acetyltransferase|nr:GNAT family N-acetyltransferase [Flavobacteriales bacterium]MBK7942389.1 GNAT family N-acetyltransferase [Flavobacteriales bacterium]MBK8948204.1 GNAT family N-acetyltransferase [Flavobacteriales bacterium]MBK9699209.1 GNAT family N-acetyltransferase [Flavobacteriales bacterium]
MIRLPIPSLDGLTTDRLTFRRLVPEDVSWWMDYIASAEAIRFMPFTVGSRSDAEAMIHRSLDRYAADGSGLHAVLLREGGTPVGQVGLLTQEVDGVAELEVGYHLRPGHWGGGYATEAAVACRRFAGTHRLAPTLISLIDPDNHRSQAVARRNGMAPEKRTMHRGVEALVFRTAPGGR